MDELDQLIITLNSSPGPKFLFLKNTNEIARMDRVTMVVIAVNPAPNPKPMAIDRKRYTSSSGSLIGVLNLTIDKAPTRPNDKAKELLTKLIEKFNN